MRTAFHQQLKALTAALAAMCAAAGQAMQDATTALLGADVVLAEAVIAQHSAMKQRAARAEHDAVALLVALQAPVAGDLRAVIAALQNIADADRMGALARHIAQITRRRHPVHAVPGNVESHFAAVGRIAVNLAITAEDVIERVDPQQAAQLRHDDDAIDELHRQLFGVLMNQQWPRGIAAVVDVTLLSRYYERFADHAVAIGRRVIFQATGNLQLPDEPTPST